MKKLRTYEGGWRNLHTYEEMPPEKRPQDPHRDGTGLRFETLEHHGFDVCPEVIRVTDSQGRAATYQIDVKYSDQARRPEDQEGDGSKLKIRTADYGGEYDDDMPQRLRVTDAKGRWADYEPTREDGRVVDSRGFTLIPPGKVIALDPDVKCVLEAEPK
jgi:hypothetical protein